MLSRILISIVFLGLVTIIKCQTTKKEEEIVEPLEFNDIANVLALNLFHILPGLNLVASTLMVRLPLIKLAGVAGGETKEELMTALGFKNEGWMLNQYKRLRENIALLLTVDLVCVNKIYVNSSDIISPFFILGSEYDYGVRVELVAFKYPIAVVSHINRWMRSTTLGRLSDVIDVNDISANTSMVIVNGIHFKLLQNIQAGDIKTVGQTVDVIKSEANRDPFLSDFKKRSFSIRHPTWEAPFNYERTRQEQFYYKNGSLAYVHMMLKVDYFYFVDTGEYQIVKIRLTGNTFMIFVLPHDKDSLPSLIEKLYENPKYFAPFLSRMNPSKPIVVKIPRFKIKTYVDFTGFLQDMGVVSVFDCTISNLSGIFKAGFGPNDKMCLNKVKQRVFIDVDEMGVARKKFDAAEDGEISEDMADKMSSSSFKKVVFNRPFLFFVNIFYSNEHNHDLLTGVYYGPE